MTITEPTEVIGAAGASSVRLSSPVGDIAAKQGVEKPELKNGLQGRDSGRISRRRSRDDDGRPITRPLFGLDRSDDLPPLSTGRHRGRQHRCRRRLHRSVEPPASDDEVRRERRRSIRASSRERFDEADVPVPTPQAARRAPSTERLAADDRRGTLAARRRRTAPAQATAMVATRRSSRSASRPSCYAGLTAGRVSTL